MNIVYEPHPVSPERKAELRAGGFTIIDARFQPKAATSSTKGGGMTLPDFAMEIKNAPANTKGKRIKQRKKLGAQ